jgi:ATP-binding cassette, subfamily C (CFTR/MRP), member 1
VWTTALTILSLFVIFAIQWVEHSRLRNANGVVLFYWLFLLIAFTVKFRSLVSQQIYVHNLPYFITYCVGFGLSVVEFLVEWLWPKNTNEYEALVDEEECPVEYATVFSVLTFEWMTPLMRHGYKQYLTEDDLWSLAKKDQTKNTGKAFDDSWQHEVKHRKNPSIWVAMIRAYGGPYAFAAVFKVFSDVSQFLQPQLLRYLIAFVGSYERGEPQPVVQGGAIAVGMFFIAYFQMLMLVRFHSTFYVQDTG